MDGGLGMVSAAWRIFDDEISRWRDEGRRVDFWWRDDDAARSTPELLRLYRLAEAGEVPLALAVVPELAMPEVLEGVAPGVALIQHGTDHRNRAGEGAKKSEYPSMEPVKSMLERLIEARIRLESIAGSSVLPVLAPPWNRLAASILPYLPPAGFKGFSAYGPRSAEYPAHGLKQVNTHVDLIDWKGTRGFAGEEAVLAQAVRHLAARRLNEVDATEATGWLTHHAVHDEATWTFLARLFDATCGTADVLWQHPAELFDCAEGS